MDSAWTTQTGKPACAGKNRHEDGSCQECALRSRHKKQLLRLLFIDSSPDYFSR